MSSLRLCTGLIGLALVLPVQAASERQELAPDARLVKPRLAGESSARVNVDAESPSARLARKFLERKGGDWRFRTDPRTDRFSLIQGSGLPLIPGKGNRLGTEVLAGLDLVEGKVTATALEPLARAFVEEQRELIAPATGRLVLDRKASAARDGERLVSIYYDWVVDGVPVEGAKVFLRINSGNVTQFGSRWVGPIDVETTPRIKPAVALRRLLEHGGNVADAQIRDEPELIIQVEDDDGTALVYRLVWKLSYEVPGQIETWEGRVDALTGEIVGLRDINHYARAFGGVYPRNPRLSNETRVPLPMLEVFSGGTNITDTGGSYNYAGGSANSSLNGWFFDVDCDGCNNPTQPFVQTTVGTGLLDFGLGGNNQAGNGFSTPSGRSAHYHLNRIRRLALKWIPQLGWLNTLHIKTNVNLAGVTCNAFYNGTVNFARSSAACGNSGLYSDIVYHEWGHGIDGNTLGGDGGTGEGTADVVAMHMTRGSQIAPLFFNGGAPIRYINWRTSPRGLMTVARINSGGCNVLVGGGLSVHCVGEVFGQSAYDLAQALAAKHGHHTGWRTSERIFFTSLFDQGSYDPVSPFNIYDAYLNADDDDGNLANGTPNGAEIYDAFRTHGMDTQAATSSPICARPQQPSLSVTPQCGSFDLEWSSVTNADHYEIFRSEMSSNVAYLPVGEVPGAVTSFTDETVGPGIAYYYVVMAVDASGCESTVEAPVLGSLPNEPLLEAVDFVVDDTPRGNRSGFPDPGEEVDLAITLRNGESTTASAISGTLVSESSGVTVLQGTSAWSNLAAGQTGQNLDTLRILIDSSLPCGSLIKLRIDPDQASGCPSDPSFVQFTLGERIGFDFVCDLTPACFEVPSFGGIESAGPGGSCGEVLLGWSDGEPACEGGNLVYNIYRDSGPGFTPGPENQVAEAVAGNQYLDTVPVPGNLYHYIVRAVDPRVGEESNGVELSTTAPTSPDLGAPVFGGIVSAESTPDCGETVLSWTPALEACTPPVTYDVYRSTDDGFTPGPSSWIGATQDTDFVDVALEGGEDYTYVVRARDLSGNAETNDVRLTAQPVQIEIVLDVEPFDPTDGGWQVVEPNNASAGNWQWGDPFPTLYQPGNDATPNGTRCWITGLLNGPGENDVDGGTTTLMSTRYDLTGTADPSVRYRRWFTNDRGNFPGESTDRMRLEVSSDDGATWRAISSVGAGTPLEWVESQVGMPGSVARTSEMRFRFTVADLGADSVVEAGVDDFEVVDRNGGCAGCSLPVEPVSMIDVGISGDDVVIDWSDDPAQGARYVVYTLRGDTFEQALRARSTTEQSYVHTSAMSSGESFFYRVSVVDECGNESAVDGVATGK